MENTEDTGLRGLAEFVADQHKIQTFKVNDAEGIETEVIAIPDGMHVEGVKKYADEWLMTPRRAVGTSNHLTVASFLEHVAKFKDQGSAIYANGDVSKPQVMAIYNYHFDQSPRFGDHRAVLDCRLSDEWKVWTANANKAMRQHDFAMFIEDNIGDIQPAPNLKDANNEILKEISMTLAYPFAGQSDMLKLSRGIEIFEASKAKSIVNLQTGERTLEYQGEHKDGDGNKLTIPGLFLIAIPVFKDGIVYRLPVRLRYRLQDGSVNWSYDIYRDDKAFKLAYDETCVNIEEATGIKVYVGSPE
jgi:uncharacterized protein YfdQ (DUF2303 family)